MRLICAIVNCWTCAAKFKLILLRVYVFVQAKPMRSLYLFRAHTPSINLCARIVYHIWPQAANCQQNSINPRVYSNSSSAFNCRSLAACLLAFATGTYHSVFEPYEVSDARASSPKTNQKDNQHRHSKRIS